MNIVTRFAPSPTGSLHLGGVRTALYNWLFARQNNGTFILRIEDTDLERSTEDSYKGIIESLKWLGLNWDEGPFLQSERMPIYFEHLNILREKGVIYPAFETKEELEAMRQKAVNEKRNPIYDRASLNLSKDEINKKIESGQPFVWRFKVPDEGVTIVPELLMSEGNINIVNNTIGDFVITRPGTKDNPGIPLYNFVCTIDDALMKITHIIRGVEHLTNAAKQVLLYQAFNYPIPKFIHLPLITKNGKKMSKRDKDTTLEFPVSVIERKELGYLPEATLNHIALLGWSSPDANEILSVENLISSFSLERLSKSNANFDEEKYLFLNSYYIKNIPEDSLLERVLPFYQQSNLNISKFDAKTLKKIICLEKERCKRLIDFPEASAFFFERPAQYDEMGINKFLKSNLENANLILESTVKKLQSIEVFTLENIENSLKETVAEIGIPFSKFGPTIRLILTGRMNSPSLAEVIDVLGKTESLERLQKGLAFCKTLN